MQGFSPKMLIGVDVHKRGLVKYNEAFQSTAHSAVTEIIFYKYLQ